MKKPKAKQQRSSKARLKQNPPIKVKKQSGEKKFKIPTMKSLKESLSKEAVTGKKEMVLNTVIHILLLLLNPLLIYYFVEAIYWQSFSRALGFLVLESAPAIHMLNVGVILILELLLWFLTNRVGLSFGITAFISCGLAIVNELKMEARGEAFTFGDISVAKEALLVAGNYDLQISQVDWTVIGYCIAMVVVLLVCLPPVFDKQFKCYMVRLASGVACLMMFTVFSLNIEDMIEKAGGNNSLYIASTWYNENGFPLGVVRTSPRGIKAPDNYPKETINSIKTSILKKTTQTDSYSTPNIIFIMNESLYDITSLDGFTLNKDPLAELKKLQEEFTSGYFISPMGGGGTCNVEFEVLTGCPLDNVGGSNVLPYADKIHKDLYSLVSLMNANGYHTTSFHPNTGTYFNRRNVYTYMQFDEMNFTEEMGKLPLEGLYESDAALYQKVIDSFEANQSTNKPFFSYVITMQNHGGYDYKYNAGNITVTESSKCKNIQALQTYANLTYNSIEAFKSFINYFANIDEPTIVVMFGDHIPGLKGMGYESDFSGFSNTLKVRTTPLIVWNNYNLPSEKWEYVNAYNLATKVLNYANVKMDTFYLYGLAIENVPALTNKCYVNMAWNDVDELASFEDYKQNLWLLLYDRIFGKDYGNWNHG